jgi:hypothetical protein
MELQLIDEYKHLPEYKEYLNLSSKLEQIKQESALKPRNTTREPLELETTKLKAKPVSSL